MFGGGVLFGWGDLRALSPLPSPPPREEPKPPPLRRKSSANYRGYAVEPHAKVGMGGGRKGVVCGVMGIWDGDMGHGVGTEDVRGGHSWDAG